MVTPTGALHEGRQEVIGLGEQAWIAGQPVRDVPPLSIATSFDATPQGGKHEFFFGGVLSAAFSSLPPRLPAAAARWCGFLGMFWLAKQKPFS